MDIAQFLTKLSALAVLPADRLDRLQTTLTAAGAPAPELAEATLVALFDELDGLPVSPEVVSAMSLVADSTDSLRAGGTSPAGLTAAVTRLRDRPSLAAARARVPATHRPAATRNFAATGTALTAAGAPLPDGAAVATELTRAFERAANRPGEAQVALRMAWEYPADRVLGADPVANTAALDAATSPVALVASGGVCHPVNVDYSIPGFSVDDRPIRDSLPGFQATRGGVRFLTPPTLASTAGATGIWTAATDATPAGATKPVLAVTCPTETEVLVDAIPTRLRLGNMTARFAPEVAAAVLRTALAQAARVAEVNLLTKISTLSTTVSSGQLLGATRDLLATVDQAAAAYRYRGRIPRSTRLRVILPEFARDLLRADLARELAHDNDAIDEFAIDDARIDAWFTVRGLLPTFALDGLPAQGSGVAYGLQGFGAQGANAALLDWPRQLVWFLFVEGSFQFLDGGRLEVGVVRDATLNSTNDYETFVEGFEGLAFRGLESLQIVSTVRPNGLSASTKDTSTY